MSYTLRLRGSTERDLRQLPLHQAGLILKRVASLVVAPKPAGSKELAGSLRGLRRLRVGDYRVAYVVDEDSKVVEVWQIGHRRDFYRRLNRQW